MGCSRPRPCCFIPAKEPEDQFYRGLGWPRCRSGGVQKTIAPAGARTPNRSTPTQSLYPTNVSLYCQRFKTPSIKKEKKLQSFRQCFFLYLLAIRKFTLNSYRLMCWVQLQYLEEVKRFLLT